MCCSFSDGLKVTFGENLDVDKVLAVLDDVDVSVVDGLLVVFDTSGPIRG